jgi:hypothetical protein
VLVESVLCVEVVTQLVTKTTIGPNFKAGI